MSQKPAKIRRIVHVDMDAFYASVEQRDHPELRGRPVVVGADPAGGKGRGVVSAASYEARRFGIHSAMPISRAFRACPTAAFVQPHFDSYLFESRRIMTVMDRFSPIVEPISIDEAFLDCTGTEELFGNDPALGSSIRAAIHEVTGLTCSVGIAPNKYIAKVASDLNKPDGMTICPPGQEREFLSPLALKALWGAGPKTVARLAAVGCRTIGDVARLPPALLAKQLGRHGEHFRRLALGIDNRPVEAGHLRKSISEERTFGVDTADNAVLRRRLLHIADELARRMRGLDLRGRTLHFKIRLEGFETFTRSRTLPVAVNERTTLLEFAEQELNSFDRRGKKVRLLGIGVSTLVPASEPEQLSLWSSTAQEADELLDTLKSRFGTKLSRASLLGVKERFPVPDPPEGPGPS